MNFNDHNIIARAAKQDASLTRVLQMPTRLSPTAWYDEAELSGWRAGEPESIGWWIASAHGNVRERRYWNGTNWSKSFIYGMNTPEEVADISMRHALLDCDEIRYRGLV